MMTSNHGLAGMLLALTALMLFPKIAISSAVVGLIGGIFPDLDLVFEHRKTLHYPVYYSVAALVLLVLGLIFSSFEALLSFYFFGAAALHTITDYFVAIQKEENDEGNGGVIFLHYRDEWVGPKKIIRYAGSPEDLLVGVLIALPLLTIYSESLFWLSIFTLLGSFLYFAKRQYRRHVY